MPRPVPAFPPLPRRRRRPVLPTLLTVPDVSPLVDLHTLRVLVKPHDWTRDALRHRLQTGDPAGKQPFLPADAADLAAAVARAADRLGVRVRVSVPDAGSERFVVEMPGVDAAAARALAAVASFARPRLWMRLGRLALYGGYFWRRERGHKLHLVRARDVHVRRDLRAALADLLRRKP